VIITAAAISGGGDLIDRAITVLTFGSTVSIEFPDLSMKANITFLSTSTSSTDWTMPCRTLVGRIKVSR
jgi:hypothetical protein